MDGETRSRLTPRPLVIRSGKDLPHPEAHSNSVVAGCYVDQCRAQLKATVNIHILEGTVTIRIKMIVQSGLAVAKHIESCLEKCQAAISRCFLIAS